MDGPEPEQELDWLARHVWDVTGPPGTIGGVFAALGQGFLVLAPFGALLIDGNAAFEVVGPKPLPFSVGYLTPAVLPPGTVYIQSYGVDPGIQVGQLTNILANSAT